MAKKALLMILDGWGIGKHDKGDVIFKTPTPYLDYLTAVSAHSTLQTCGEDVGLPKGQMGNSEVSREFLASVQDLDWMHWCVRKLCIPD